MLAADRFNAIRGELYAGRAVTLHAPPRTLTLRGRRHLELIRVSGEQFQVLCGRSGWIDFTRAGYCSMPR